MDTSPKVSEKLAEVPVDVELENDQKQAVDEAKKAPEQSTKRHKFYVSSPEETEDTELELELEEVVARGKIGIAQGKAAGQNAKGRGNGAEKSTTFGSSTNVSMTAVGQAKGTRRDQQLALSTSSRSISEVLRSKLAALPVREEGNFTLGCTKPLVQHFVGIRTVFAFLGFLSAVATCFLPAAIELGFFYVLACRVLQGVAFSGNFPVIGAFTSKWTYYKQNGLFVSVLVAYVQFAPAVTLPVSGALCEFFGWPSVFFVHGAATSVLFTIFPIFFRNSPNKHSSVGEVEMRKIAVGKSELGKEYQKKIPLKEILSTGSVWAVWIAAIGNFVCVNMMFLYSPNYLNSVLNFPIAHTGVSASLAPLAQFGIKLFAGFTSDKIRAISETNKLRLYNSVAFFGAALFLTILAFFPTEYPTICLALLGISAGLLGFTTGGFFKAGPLVAKHYALVVMGQISLAITVTLLLVPIMQNTFAPHNSAEEWRSVFLITAATLAVTNAVFCLLCSAEPAEWTTDEFSRSASRNKVHAVEAVQTPKLNVPSTLG
uniref:MFS domain-containing protein n=1 Tax=Globodera pallida TaxID=36090 RepID=A0A183BR44_GLOPA